MKRTGWAILDVSALLKEKERLEKIWKEVLKWDWVRPILTKFAYFSTFVNWRNDVIDFFPQKHLYFGIFVELVFLYKVCSEKFALFKYAKI
jgi:hypothetical protein